MTGQASEDRPGLRLVEWKPVAKGALRGFVSVELPIGLTIREMPVLVGAKGPWVSLPGKAQIDSEGRVRRDPAKSNKIAYVAVLAWRDKGISDRFSKAVIDLLLATHPRALSDAP